MLTGITFRRMPVDFGIQFARNLPTRAKIAQNNQQLISILP